MSSTCQVLTSPPPSPHSPLAGDCVSNDPVLSTEADYKPWSGPFGSCRPIRGIRYRTLICKVQPEWENSTRRFEREHVGTFEESNDSYETCSPSWPPTLALSGSVSHHFTLQTPQNVPGQQTFNNSPVILSNLSYNDLQSFFRAALRIIYGV